LLSIYPKLLTRSGMPRSLINFPPMVFQPNSVLCLSSYLSNRRISVIVDGHSLSFHQVNAGVPQGSVLAPTLFLLHINDLLSSTTNSIHSFADDSTLHASFQVPKPISKPDLESKRRAMQISLSQDLNLILDWGAKNLVHFNASKTQSCTLSRKESSNTHPLLMSGQVLQSKDTFNLVGVTFENNLNWHKHIVSIATAASQKLGFLFRAKKYFSPSHLYTLYVSQIRPPLEYCSHIWGMASPTTLSILDSIQRRAVRLINDPSLTERLPSLAHRRPVGDLSLFYRYFHGFCSEELSSIIPPLTVPNRETRGAARMHPYTVQLDRPRTSHFVRSFIPRVSRMWNLLPAEVFPSPPNLQVFKSRVNKLPLTSLKTTTVR
jgi:reverse transcriptase-like protein